MPLATSDRLRFLEFLGLIAGLLIVFVSTNSIYFPFGLPSESVLVLLLILFIAYSLFVYVEILSREKSSTKFIFSAAIYFSVILSLLFSGTVLKAFAAETSTSSTIGAFLFIILVISYNVVILIPIQKIMKDEPSGGPVPTEKIERDEPSKSEIQSGQGESKVKE
jgi:signal transduction histidine kinase